MKRSLLFLSAVTLASAAFAQEAAPQGAGLKFSGFLQFRTEWTANPRVTAQEAGDAQNADLGPADPDGKSATRTCLWLNVDNQFDGQTRFHALVNAETLGGRTTGDYLKLWAAFAEAKAGPATFAVGRFLTDVGLGTLGSAPYMDGAHVTVGGEAVEAQVYLTKFGNPGGATDYNTADKSSYTYVMGDLKVRPVRGLTLSVAYFGDATTKDPSARMIGGTLYRSWAAGAEYRYERQGTAWFTLSGEYADNAGAMARKINGTTAPYAFADCTEGANPRAMYAKVKLLGAKAARPGSFGLSAQVRKADAGFDAMGFANPHTWNAPFNWTTPGTGGIADNEKGVELAGEVTVLPRCVFSVAWGLMKLANTSSTLDLASPALAVVNSVTPTGGAPIVSMVTGAQNKAGQNYVTAAVHYNF